MNHHWMKLEPKKGSMSSSKQTYIVTQHQWMRQMVNPSKTCKAHSKLRLWILNKRVSFWTCTMLNIGLFYSEASFAAFDEALAA